MNVIGIDLSLTSTGIAAVVDETIVSETIVSKPNKADPTGAVRRNNIVRELSTWITAEPNLIVIEGPVQRSYAVIGLSMLHGCVLELLRAWCLLDRTLIVPPNTLKKYATGKGIAPKSEMVGHLIRRLGDAVEGVPSNDEADAIWLAALGAHLLGTPLVDLPKTHTDHLEKLDLPEGITT